MRRITVHWLGSSICFLFSPLRKYIECSGEDTGLGARKKPEIANRFLQHPIMCKFKGFSRWPYLEQLTNQLQLASTSHAKLTWTTDRKPVRSADTVQTSRNVTKQHNKYTFKFKFLS